MEAVRGFVEASKEPRAGSLKKTEDEDGERGYIENIVASESAVEESVSPFVDLVGLIESWPNLNWIDIRIKELVLCWWSDRRTYSND